MAITKVIDVQVKSNVKDTTQDVEKLNESVKQTSKSADGLSKELGKSGNAKQVFQGITNVITEMHPALGRAEGGFKAVLTQMWAMVANPIGAVIAALVVGLSLLFKAFTSTEQGAEKMEQVMSGISAVLTVLRDRVLKIGEAIGKFFSGDFAGAIKIGREAVSGFGAEVTKEFNEAMQATKMLQDVEDAMRDLGVSRAKLNRDLAQTKEIISDENATFAQKIDAINKVRKAEAAQTAAELEASRKRVEALRIEASQSEGVSDEKRQKLADAQAALYQLEETSAANIRSLNKQENRLRKEEAARIAEIEKAIIADRAKYLESTLTYEETLLKAKYKSRKDLISAEMSATSEQLKKDIDAANLRAATNLTIANSDKFNFEQRLAAVASREAMESQMVFKSESDRTKFQEENAKARMAIAEAEKQAKIQALDAVAGALGAASDLLGKSTGAGKVLAIAQATISTFTSAQKAYEATVGIPFVGPTLAPINAGLAIAAGFKNIQAIAKVKVPNGGGGSSLPSAGGGPSTTAVPQFNVVGNSGVNQLAGVIGNRENQPVKAYVVPSDVTSGQSLDRNTIRNASIG